MSATSSTSKRMPPRARLRQELGERVVEHRVEQHVVEAFLAERIGARDVQEIVHHREAAADVATRRSAACRPRSGRSSRPRPRRAPTAPRHERRAQIVGEVVDELGPRPLGAPDLRDVDDARADDAPRQPVADGAEVDDQRPLAALVGDLPRLALEQQRVEAATIGPAPLVALAVPVGARARVVPDLADEVDQQRALDEHRAASRARARCRAPTRRPRSRPRTRSGRRRAPSRRTP